MTNANWTVWALTAGMFGSLASICGKLMSTSSTFGNSSIIFHQIFDGLLSANQVAVAVRGCWLAVMICMNVAMWHSFTASLKLAPSTVHSSSISTSANILFTGMFGHLIFNEAVSHHWLTGALCLIAGSVLISSTSFQTSQHVSYHEHENEYKRK